MHDIAKVLLLHTHNTIITYGWVNICNIAQSMHIHNVYKIEIMV